jgi:hypothetical protein
MVLKELYSSYLAIRRANKWQEGEKELAKGLRAAWESVTLEDIQWLSDCLASEPQKWFTAFLLSRVRQVPESLYMPMIMAGIDETNPSFNRQFIEPCIVAFGHRRVNTTLLDVFEIGTDARKAGVASALYWAGVRVALSADAREIEAKLLAEMQDVWVRKHRLLLMEFVRNPDLQVRRRIIPKLNLEPSSYSPELQVFVQEAIRIAREHPDDYIRHRVEIQLGTSTGAIFKPLPS